LQTRLAGLTFEAFEQAHFLAADIGAGAAMEIKVEIEARAARVLAEEAGRVSLLDRSLKIQRLVIEFTADIDVAGGRAHRRAREQATLDQLMRIVANDVAILAGARFGFVGVDDEIAWPVAALKDQVLGAVPIAARLRAFERPVELAVEIGEDAVFVGEHQVAPFAK